jgi:hypothetical protein
MEVEPIDLVALTAVILGCLMFLIPIAGLTLRFAIKPISEAIGRMNASGTEQETLRLLERRVALLEQEVGNAGEVRADLSRLLEDLEFQKQLTESRR